jgi:hypothetical protein
VKNSFWFFFNEQIVQHFLRDLLLIMLYYELKLDERVRTRKESANFSPSRDLFYVGTGMKLNKFSMWAKTLDEIFGGSHQS